MSSQESSRLIPKRESSPPPSYNEVSFNSAPVSPRRQGESVFYVQGTGNTVLSEPPPPYSSTTDVRNIQLESMVASQPRRNQQRQKASPIAQVAPTSNGCCEFLDACCTACVCCLCLFEVCHHL